ncbi:predicted protein [Naegleria gruberi]|uniref:Predicted protein n=1 Tax=Naegleria gruberi TaxID=5762 RepID=D2W3H0_NAEGR|nr:uncharacterized protein NAEGRDRAFT_75941 [Naegleria gruberi]EFC36383.1 predicted protein [Naegleria gruberi]|eukprot:XP_002669127.1 predicted protein [Naegleria gruberi strain NEG-M]
MGVSMNMPGFGMTQPQTQVSYTQTTTTNYMPTQQYPTYNNSLARQIIQACENASFDNDKVKAVQTYSSAQCCPINGADLVTILDLFGFDNDKITVLSQLRNTNNIFQMNCNEAAQVLESFGFDNDKLKALELLLISIYDRKQHAETIVGGFGFDNDQSKARTILLK